MPILRQALLLMLQTRRRPLPTPTKRQVLLLMPTKRQVLLLMPTKRQVLLFLALKIRLGIRVVAGLEAVGGG